MPIVKMNQVNKYPMICGKCKSWLQGRGTDVERVVKKKVIIYIYIWKKEILHIERRHGMLWIGYRSWKSNLSDKIKRNFFQATVVSVLLYDWPTGMLTKHKEKNLDGNCTRMLRAILNKFWKQHPTKQQLFGHLPPISKTIQIIWTKHAGHF